MQTAIQVFLTGVGATMVMDLYGLILRGLGFRTLDYALVGRWIGHMRLGRFAHADIGAAQPAWGERSIGWAAHYATGAFFAVVLAMVVDEEWWSSPTLWPALVTGLGTVLAPWVIMQPAFGAGFAAARTPRPASVRIQNLFTHFTFGLGLFATAWLIAQARY